MGGEIIEKDEVIVERLQNCNINGNIDGNTESEGLNDDGKRIDSSPREVGEKSSVAANTNGLTVSKTGEAEDLGKEHSTEQKGQGTIKHEDIRTAALLKKSKNEKGTEAAFSVNGISTAYPFDKQLIESTSFINDHTAGGNVSILSKSNKLTATKHNSNPSKSDGASPSISTTQPESHKEMTRLKHLNKTVSIIADGFTKSVSLKEEEKPHKMGTLPSYGFSFKCNERAERRKEFYSKLEEKTHAREEEKSTLQAQSKKTQEAEIKILRKSLTFKATPMPSFYLETQSPKVELKKIPTTRAKSPKLGRKKSLGSMESEEKIVQNDPLKARLSLDQKLPHNHSAIRPKTPLQKSLSKLPFEKIKLPISTKEAILANKHVIDLALVNEHVGSNHVEHVLVNELVVALDE